MAVTQLFNVKSLCIREPWLKIPLEHIGGSPVFGAAPEYLKAKANAASGNTEIREKLDSLADIADRIYWVSMLSEVLRLTGKNNREYLEQVNTSLFSIVKKFEHEDITRFMLNPHHQQDVVDLVKGAHGMARARLLWCHQAISDIGTRPQIRDSYVQRKEALVKELRPYLPK